MRVVIDTNVLLSAALLPTGVPARVVDRLLATGTLVFSEATFAELEARLWLPKFDRYLPLELRHRLVLEMRAAALWVDIPSQIGQRSFCRDADDDKFIHTALAAGASLLISGDEDLLRLPPLDGLRILSPRQALDDLEAAT